MKGRRRLFDDDAGVSSVISVILMVAIAVILAAVVATFALGFTDNSDVAPPSAFTGEQVEKRLVATGGNAADFWALRITYEGGETIDEERLTVLVNGEKAYGVKNTSRSVCSDPKCHEAVSLWNSSGSITAGDTVTVVHGDDATISAGDGYDILPDGGDDPASTRLWANGQATGGPRLELDTGDTVRVVWESESGDTTALLFERDIE